MIAISGTAWVVTVANAQTNRISTLKTREQRYGFDLLTS
jgi:hypothetical protein